jgi:hypothetical protein
VQPYRLQRVRATRRVEPAPGCEQRADEAAVPVEEQDEKPGRGRWPLPGLSLCCARHGRCAPPCRRSKAPITRSSSAARSVWRAVAARGLARTTNRLPSGSDPRYPRARCLSRRRTRLRTTAPPTARLTTKPTRAGSSCPAWQSRCAESSCRPARRPPRIAAVKSERRRIRDAAGSTGGHQPASLLPRAPGLRGSDTDPRAPLTAPCGKDRAPRAGPHAQPEPVRLRAVAVVRLERTLAHWDSRYREASAGTHQRAARVSGHGEQSPAGGQGQQNDMRAGAAGQKQRYAGRHCASRRLRAPLRLAAVTRPSPRIPLPDSPGSHWHPPQHLPFAKRVPNPTPRLWTSDPGRGDPDQVIA